MKEIKPYKKVSASKRGSKDLVFCGEGWENFVRIDLLFWVIKNVSPFATQNIWLWGNQNSAGRILGWRIVGSAPV